MKPSVGPGSYTDVFNRKQEEAISTRKRTRSARIASPRILNNILEQQQFQNRLIELEAKRRAEDLAWRQRLLEMQEEANDA